jgi:hypothetical protein
MGSDGNEMIPDLPVSIGEDRLVDSNSAFPPHAPDSLDDGSLLKFLRRMCQWLLPVGKVYVETTPSPSIRKRLIPSTYRYVARDMRDPRYFSNHTSAQTGCFTQKEQLSPKSPLSLPTGMIKVQMPNDSQEQEPTHNCLIWPMLGGSQC